MYVAICMYRCSYMCIFLFRAFFVHICIFLFMCIIFFVHSIFLFIFFFIALFPCIYVCGYVCIDGSFFHVCMSFSIYPLPVNFDRRGVDITLPDNFDMRGGRYTPSLITST